MTLREEKPEITLDSDRLLAGVLGNNRRAMDFGEVAFLSVFKEILVGDFAPISFNGSLKLSHMRLVWVWLSRDVMPEIKQHLLGVKDIDSAKSALQPHLSELIAKASDAIFLASDNPDTERRLIAQLGGEEIKLRLPIIINTLKCNSLLSKASSFGKSSNSLEDDELEEAILSLPLKEKRVTSLLFHAIVGQTKDPSRLIIAASNIIGGALEKSYKGAGFEPLIEAMFAHAQNQISIIEDQAGHFGDVDLICNAIIRYHHLMRAIGGNVEIERGSHWYKTTAELTKFMAQRIEPRLNNVSFNVNSAMRKPRSGPDKVDADQLLSALNGIYLLVAVRQARETLALNAIFEKIWGETGQSLEVLIDRNMEVLKQDPTNAIVLARLDAGIKMAGLRFGQEYGDVLLRAKQVIERRQKQAV